MHMCMYNGTGTPAAKATLSMTTLKAASSSEDTVTFGAKMATPGSEALPTATDEGGRFAAAATSTISWCASGQCSGWRFRRWFHGGSS
mmetsp:Transcript_84811/g.137549  ORF Transcript_84811/g.137549 Transcript_84811/m.137549 type:complete len:88 (+) Transcript_84811:162-425(+)